MTYPPQALPNSRATSVTVRPDERMSSIASRFETVGDGLHRHSGAGHLGEGIEVTLGCSEEQVLATGSRDHL